MAKNPVTDDIHLSDVGKKSSRAVKSKTSSPVKKPTAKRTVKSTAKPVAKAKTKLVAKPVARKSVKAKKATAVKAKGKAKPKKVALPKLDKKAKPKKSKLIRDSFTMPDAEYELFAAVKKRCVAKGVAVKKSEVLRAALISFAAKSDAAVMVALKSLEFIKTGRKPKAQK